MASIPNRPSQITHDNLNFLILDAPSDTNLHLYIKELKKNNVRHLVRVCSETYTTSLVEREGIKVHHWPFNDGDPPPKNIVDDWLGLVKSEFENPNGGTIAVHCVAGLGRAPVLVAIALVESGMEPLDAIQFIRERRRGAINTKQMEYIEKYKPKRGKKNCIIS